MLTLPWILVCLTLPSTLGAEEPQGITEERLPAYIEKRVKDIVLLQDQLAKELKAAQVGRIDAKAKKDVNLELVRKLPKFTFQSKELKKSKVEILESSLSRLDDSKQLLSEMPHKSGMEVDQVGRLVEHGKDTDDGYSHYFKAQ